MTGRDDIKGGGDAPRRGNAPPIYLVVLAPFLVGTPGVALLAGSARAAAPVSSADRAFLAWDAQIEIQQQDMGRLAERRARSQAVRHLGITLVQHHGQAQQRLAQVAAGLGVSLSTTLSETHLRIQRRYAGMASSGFDQAFVHHEIGDYRYFLAHFEPAARTSNPLLRAYCIGEIAQLKQDQARLGVLLAEVSDAPP